MKFFPTQLETYQNCPRKYSYSRDKELRAKYSKASPHLVLGNAVHDALQVFFDLSRVSIGDRTYERLCDLLRQAWGGAGHFKRNHYKQAEARAQAFDGDRDLEKAWGEKGLNILFRFFGTADLAAVPLTAEQFHEIRLTDHVTLGGKIDRIDRRPDGSLVVLDYKTGKAPQVQSPDAIARKDIQLAAYALLVTRKFRGRVARCSYLYLDHEMEVGYEPDDAFLLQKEGEIVELCQTILNDEEYEPRPNPLCPWCDFREICPKGDVWEKSVAPAAKDELPF
jgi:putative RecB family exonuclease